MTTSKSDLSAEQVLAVAACDVLTSISERNLAHGDTFKVGIPRRYVEALAAALEQAHPGYLERVRRLEREAAEEPKGA